MNVRKPKIEEMADIARTMGARQQHAAKIGLTVDPEEWRMEATRVLAKRAVHQLAETNARLKLAPKYPSRLERFTHWTVGPAHRVVERVNNRLNRMFVNFAARRGLPVGEELQKRRDFPENLMALLPRRSA